MVHKIRWFLLHCCIVSTFGFGTFGFGKELDESKVDERVECADFFSSNPTVLCRDFQQFSKKLSSTFNWRLPTFVNCADFLLPANTTILATETETWVRNRNKKQDNTCYRETEIWVNHEGKTFAKLTSCSCTANPTVTELWIDVKHIFNFTLPIADLTKRIVIF